MRTGFIPANRTVIFTGFNKRLEKDAIVPFCLKCFSADQLVLSGLVDQEAISVNSGKACVNFKDCVAARRAIELLRDCSVDDICDSGGRVDIWLKDRGRSSMVSSKASISLSEVDPER